MGLEVGEHSGITTTPIHRAKIDGTRRYRDTPLAKHDGDWFAADDADHAEPLPLSRYRSRTRFRDLDGRVKIVQAEGASRAEAERTLRRKITDKTRAVSRAGRLHSGSTVATLWDVHRQHLEQRGYASRSLDTFDRLIRSVLDDMGGLTVAEIRTSRLQEFLDDVEAGSGPTTARMTRSLLSAMWGTAARHDAVDRNPVADTLRPQITVEPTSAPTIEQVAGILDALRSSTALVPAEARAKKPASTPVHVWAHRLATDVTDPVVFLAATGVRVSELFGLRWQDVDLAEGTATIVGRAVWLKGKGVVWEQGAKSAAGARTIALPKFCVGMLMDRHLQGARPSVYVFPAVGGGVRDSNAFRRQWRRVRGVVGAEGIDPHDFRRGVATALYDAGLGHRAADVLGHGSPRMAEDRYVARSRVHADAAELIESQFGATE